MRQQQKQQSQAKEQQGDTQPHTHTHTQTLSPSDTQQHKHTKRQGQATQAHPGATEVSQSAQHVDEPAVQGDGARLNVNDSTQVLEPELDVHGGGRRVGGDGACWRG